jgi:3-oxo-5-alpha-steroid 4-dehydrogenase 1
MIAKNIFDLIVLSWIVLACLVFPILLFVAAPYGRHSTGKWGMTISNREGWILMEVPALLIFLYLIASGKADKNAVVWIIVSLFTIHYANRSLIYPFRINTQGKRMPLLIVIMAIFFNTVNGYINGYYLGTLQHQYSYSWFTDPRFIVGIMLFFAGMIINISADEILIHLRKSKTNGYQIPYGNLFNKISCPNFFGEIIEWFGFAILCWSLPALSFLVWTVCNLVPRALDHHRWYKRQFADYPLHRKAIFPYLL